MNVVTFPGLNLSFEFSMIMQGRKYLFEGGEDNATTK